MFQLLLPALIGLLAHKSAPTPASKTSVVQDVAALGPSLLTAGAGQGGHPLENLLASVLGHEAGSASEDDVIRELAAAGVKALLAAKAPAATP